MVSMNFLHHCFGWLRGAQPSITWTITMELDAKSIFRIPQASSIAMPKSTLHRFFKNISRRVYNWTFLDSHWSLDDMRLLISKAAKPIDWTLCQLHGWKSITVSKIRPFIAVTSSCQTKSRMQMSFLKFERGTKTYLDQNMQFKSCKKRKGPYAYFLIHTSTGLGWTGITMLGSFDMQEIGKNIPVTFLERGGKELLRRHAAKCPRNARWSPST